MAIGCYPGSFNPPTLAHLAIAEWARHAAGLKRVDLVVSRVALEKEHVDRPTLEHRLEVLEAVARARPWLGVVVRDRQLLVDLAEGYDVLILGADKWAQVRDPRFYGGSIAARDTAVAALPRLVLCGRPGHLVVDAPVGAFELSLPEHLRYASSTAARAGREEWMSPEAADFDRSSGAWTDPVRYEAWLRHQQG